MEEIMKGRYSNGGFNIGDVQPVYDFCSGEKKL